MLFYILVSVFVVILYLWYQKRKEYFLLFQKLQIPGPTPNIFFGNFLEIFIKGSITCHKEWTSKYGKVVGYFQGLSPVLMVTDTDLLKNIQIKDFQKFINRPHITNEPIRNSTRDLNKNLINLTGSKWKEIRSVITPTFTTSKMKVISPILNDTTSTLLENFEKYCETGEVFDSYKLFQRFTLDAISRTAFGIKTKVQNNPEDHLFKLACILVHEPFRVLFLFISNSFLFLQPLMNILRTVSGIIINRGSNPLIGFLDKCKEIVDYRKKNPMYKRPDFLQLLIEAKIKEKIDVDYQTLTADDKIGKETNEIKETENGVISSRSLSTNEMVANSLLFLLAGFETTSTALAFITIMLANFQDVQDKIRKEINELLEKENELYYDSIHKLQYMDQVVKEILRIYPPVHSFVNREAAEDVQYGKMMIPKGMAVHVPVYLLHHDSEYWEQPEEFRPERFAPENVNKNNPLAWQPFGAGPRNCVGMRFAILEIKLVLAHMLYKYRLLPGKNTDKYPLEIQLDADIIRPKFGVPIRLERC